MKFLAVVSSLLFTNVFSYHQVDVDFAGKAQVAKLSPTTYVNLGQLQKSDTHLIDEEYLGTLCPHAYHRVHPYCTRRSYLTRHSNFDANLAGDFKVSNLSPETKINLGQLQYGKKNLIKKGFSGSYHPYGYRHTTDVDADVAGNFEVKSLSPETKINLGQAQIYDQNFIRNRYPTYSRLETYPQYRTFTTRLHPNLNFNLACTRRLFNLNFHPRVVYKRCGYEKVPYFGPGF